MKTGLEIIALCIDHSKTDTPRVQQKIFIPFDFMLDNVVSQFTDSNFEPVDYRVTDYKQSIIELIEDIQMTELLRGWKHTSDILEELIAKIKEVK